MADNTGSNDEYRALNYLAVRFPGIYERATIVYANNFSLTEIKVRRARLTSMHRSLIDVIFTFVNRSNNFMERWAIRVDTTGEFPFIASLLSPYTEI